MCCVYTALTGLRWPPPSIRSLRCETTSNSLMVLLHVHCMQPFYNLLRVLRGQQATARQPAPATLNPVVRGGGVVQAEAVAALGVDDELCR